MFVQKTVLFSTPKIHKIDIMPHHPPDFRHIFRRFSPQIGDFRHISPVLDTFSARHDTILYFCNVLINASRRFDKLNGLKNPEPVEAPESKREILIENEMKIIGTGSALPSLTVTNDDLATFLDTNDAWISTRTGIKARHLLSTETLYDLAVDASNKAIKSAGLTPDQIDFLLVSNVANQHITPGLSCIIQNRIGVTCAGLDINVACAGFVNALMLADGMMKAGRAKNILIVCAEEPTKYCDWHERDCSVLFGDGAGAVVLAPGEAFKDVKLTMISDRDVLYYERGMETTPFEQKYTKGQPLVMKGKELFRTAVSESAKDIIAILQRNNLKHEDIDFFLLHQANKRIIEGIRNIVGGPEEKYPTVIEKYGNTSSASIPIMLDEMIADGKIKAGDKIVMSAFGAGFVSAACLWEWEV